MLSTGFVTIEGELTVHVGNFNNKNGNDKSVRLVCKNQFGIEGINKKFRNYHL